MAIRVLTTFLILGGIVILYRFAVEAAARRYGRRAIPAVLISASLAFAITAVLRLRIVETATTDRAATDNPVWMGGLFGALIFLALLPLTIRLLVAPVPTNASHFGVRAVTAVLWLIGGLLLAVTVGIMLELVGVNFLPPLGLSPPAGAA